ncbi:acyltransferase family protein [Motilibacter aurantiacus]|uniref:acyltransferase family protein n=1 Tax=Motilibacter aurantiacus TaxID=2714955 RepID=UPI00140D682A|nr:acyltransferase family protein [Motilibacter aurantiacus]NHC46349.1 acyltransferase family protein [Motilibacter aurantiacus]
MARRWPVGITVALTAAVSALGLFVEDRTFGPASPNVSLVPYLLVILLGRWVYLWHSDRLATLPAVGAGVAVLVLYTLSQRHFVGADAYSGAYPRWLAALWATVLFLALLRFVTSGPWRPIAFVADISYGLYLFHIPVMWVVLPIVSPNGTRLTLGFTCTAAALVLVAWASERFVERPVRRGARATLARWHGRKGVDRVAVPSLRGA